MVNETEAKQGAELSARDYGSEGDTLFPIYSDTILKGSFPFLGVHF